jgi:hypothetical protein
MGLVGAASEKPSFIFNLVVILIFSIHFLGCFWIYLGKTIEDSWLRGTSGIQLDIKDDTLVYISSLYWVITTLTTVGYGDFKGYTPTEYCF